MVVIGVLLICGGNLFFYELLLLHKVLFERKENYYEQKIYKSNGNIVGFAVFAHRRSFVQKK